jgi:glutamate-1-semialdehyde aminotransferase
VRCQRKINGEAGLEEFSAMKQEDSEIQNLTQQNDPLEKKLNEPAATARISMATVQGCCGVTIR